MTRIITADASKVSPVEFLDAVVGTSPEYRQQRDQKMLDQCIRAIKAGDTYGWPPAMVERCREIMAERGEITAFGDVQLSLRVIHYSNGGRRHERLGCW